MEPRTRLVVGLVLLVAVAPLMILAWPAPVPEPETAGGCMDVLGLGGGSWDFHLEPFFAAAAAAVVGLGFIISAYVGYATRAGVRPARYQTGTQRLRLTVGLVLLLLVTPLILGAGALFSIGGIDAEWIVEAVAVALVGVGLVVSARVTDGDALPRATVR